MSKRFSTSKSGAPCWLKPACVFCFFFIILIIFIVEIQKIGRGNTLRQKEILEKALNRDIIYCYVTEGNYPDNLEYIKEHYGLTYDESTFFVGYRPLGSNIYPDVTVIELED